MSDLISRRDAIDALSMMQGIVAENGVRKGISMAWQQIEGLPSAERRGRWIGSDDFDEYYRCSECGKGETQFDGLYRYCPNCGARMKGEENEPASEN